MDLKQNRCKCCGAKLNPLAAIGGVITCDYCGSSFTLPKETTSDRVLNFLDVAEHDLDTARFDEAFSGYKKAAEIEKSEPEAYFGMALAKFKVQYLKDEVKNRLQPICHEATTQKFSADKNYLKALKLATPEQSAEYKRKAEDIDYIQSEFYKLQSSGLDYNCFICVKVSGDDGKTEDSKDAEYIYHMLKDKGYKPFYSEYEIRNKQGADYEAHILYALYTSECMLVVCSNEDYLQTKWVKNEYTRFLKLVNDEEKESDSITIVFNGKAVEKLPGRKGKIQGINFALRSADGQIVNFVENHTPEARKRRQEAQNAKQKADEEQQKRIRELEEQIASLKSAPGAQAGLSEDEIKELISKYAAQQPAKDNTSDLEKQRKEIERQRKEQAEELEKQRKAMEEQQRLQREAMEEQQRLISEQLEKLKSVSATAEKPVSEGLSDDELFERMERARAERERKKKEEEARLAREAAEAARIAREKAEEERKRKEEEERKKREEEERIAREKAAEERRRAAEEEARKKKEEEKHRRWVKDNDPTLNLYNEEDFFIHGQNKELIKYRHTGGVVKIPKGVVSICGEAFKGCDNVESITIPDSVKSIGEYAFKGCPAEIIWSKRATIEEIGTHAFTEYTGESLTIPDSVKIIGEYAFSWCGNLKEVTIPKSVTKIGGDAVAYCKNLKSVIISDGVTSIGRSMFNQCASLESVTIPDSVTEIEAWAFGFCKNLKSIIIPQSVTKVGENAFYGCENLTVCCRAKKQPAGWDRDWNLAEKTDKGSIKRVKFAWGWDGDLGKESRWVKANEPTLDIFDGKKFKIDGTTLKKYSGKDKKVVIPEGITVIGKEAFAGCDNLESLTIPSSVTQIGEDAFKGCSINNIYITDLRAWCNIEFNCYSSTLGRMKKLYLNDELITELVIPEGVTQIKRYAFFYCSSIKKIIIPDSVTSIGEHAFTGCNGIKGVYINDLKAWCNITFNNYFLAYGIKLYLKNKFVTDVTAGMLRGATTIKSGAFSNYKELTSITIPDGVTSIGVNAFGECTCLTKVTIPDSVTEIGGWAFKHSRIESITLPGGITFIDDGTFDGTSLESITIPDSVTEIGDWAFNDCKNLKSIIIPQSVTKLSENAFYGCEKLTIYCRAEKQPESWPKDWNLVRSGNIFTARHAKVKWGYKG